MLNSLRSYVAGFARETRGSVSVEFVLVMPFLFWAFMASYVYFDGYRQSSINLKAAYTVSDLISRETDAVNGAYIDSMYELMQLMTRTPSEVKMRISVVRFDGPDDRYYVDWSTVRGYTELLDNSNVSDIEDKLPEMPDNERVILVETGNRFVPLFNVGLNNIQLENFVFTRPRFAPQVAWSNS